MLQTYAQPYGQPLEGRLELFCYVLTTKDHGLLYKYGNGKDFTITAYIDTRFQSCYDDSKSQLGWTFKLNRSTVAWSSNKAAIVALSSTQAEYQALSKAAGEAL
jgi:hypothetical protein